MNKYRTHNCNELRKDNLDKDISISGWINKKRDHGNLLFIDLRDNYGITQCIIDRDNSNFKSAIHCIITSSNYEQAIIKTIKAGGCNCSRAGFIGSYFAALKDRNIPLAWIKKTIPAKKILEYI